MAYSIDKLKNEKFKIRVWSKPDEFGKKKSKQVSNIPTYTQAEKLAKEIEFKLEEENNRGTQFDPNIKFSKLEEMYYNERKTKISPATLYGSFDYCRKIVLKYFGDFKVLNINSYVTQKFIDLQQERGLKQKTVKNFVTYLKATINWGVNNDIIDSNRIKKVNYAEDEEEFEATTLSLDQIVKILPVLKKKCYNIYIPTLITILTSARRGEVLGLTWNNIDFDNKTINFTNNKIMAGGQVVDRKKLKTTKSKRLVPMADFLSDELKAHRKFSSSEQVCSNTFMGDIYPDYLTHKLHEFLIEEFNIDMREHDLRHTFSQLIEENEDIIIAKSQMMGHSNIYTTMNIYTRPSFSRKARLANSLGELIREAMCAKNVCQ